jgi:predicted enzyme related to lactoylglutathione lyase
VIKAVKFVSVPVNDQDRALAFYTDALGFLVATDQPFDERQRWIELRLPGADTRVVLFMMDGWEDKVGQMLNFTFAADNVERTYQELLAKGVQFDSPPASQPWGTFAVFRDSEGNGFVLSSK